MRDPAAHAEALEEICRKYHPVFLRVMRSWDPTNAEDLTQDFILGLIRCHRMQRADPAAGRFRHYMGRMLTNFARKHYLHARRQKRGGGAEHVELTEESATTEPPGEEIFDREWARELQNRALEAFKKEEKACPELLRLALGELVLGESRMAAGYAELAARTGSAESTLRSEATRLRRRFHERLRQEAALTTVRSEIDEELRHLQRTLLARG